MRAKQRKLVRLGLADEAGYFTAAMLESDFIVRRGLRGLDPDKPSCEREHDEAKWLAAHPGISPQRKTEMREQAARVRPSSLANLNKKKGSHKGLSSTANNEGSSVLPDGSGLGNGLTREVL
jgi:hypothetical protein